MNPALEFRKVDILFASGSGARGRQADALRMLDAGQTRSAIAEATGVVVGVAGASLTLRQGEIAVLMGLSGSGKSTLLRAANGLNTVTRGQVLVQDGDAQVDVGSCDSSTLRRVRLRRVAMVFQQFALLPWRTVRENVGLGLELRGVGAAERRRVVDEKLKLVGLDAWADRHAHELSGGMQQRVGLARAFATDADILLMDEPFSALDPLIRTKLQDELLDLQARVRKSILFVSHDLDEALKLGNQISILEGGRVVQTGGPEDIVLRPADAYVAEFVRHMNPLSVLRGVSVMTPCGDLRAQDGGVWLDHVCRYHLELDAGGRPGRLRVSGTDVPLSAHDAGSLDGTAVMAPESLSLRAILHLRQATGHPVLLTDGARITGVCGEHEILRALAGRDAG